MTDLKITEIQISPLRPHNGLVGFSSFILNNYLYIGNVAIYTSPSSPDGFRLVYPSRILGNGTKLDSVFPINKNIGYAIQKQIVKEFLKIIDNVTKGDGNNDKSHTIKSHTKELP